MENYFNMDSFGSMCPDNWEAVAAFLNAALDQYGYEDENDIREAMDDIWQDYCRGDLENIAHHSTSDYGQMHLRLSTDAYAYYVGTDPCKIIEYSVDGQYLYKFIEAGNDYGIMTEDVLDRCLQGLQTGAELQICQECRESLQDYVLKVADEIATEYRETGVYNRDKLAQLKVDCDDIGWEVCEDPEYIMVEDQVFYLHERE